MWVGEQTLGDCCRSPPPLDRPVRTGYLEKTSTCPVGQGGRRRV